MPRMIEPSLRDNNWRNFCLEKEMNSGRAVDQWELFREGVRRLALRHRSLVPQAAMELSLAEDVFFCATRWRHSARIVNTALRELLEQPLDPKRYAFAAAEYWKWAREVSPRDLVKADEMLSLARGRLRSLDSLTRTNIERMFSMVLSESSRST